MWAAPGKIIGHVLHIGAALLFGHIKQPHHAAVSVLDIHRPTQIADGTAVADLAAEMVKHHLHIFLLLMCAVIYCAAAVGQLAEDLGRALQPPRRKQQPPPIILLLHGFKIKAGKHSLTALQQLLRQQEKQHHRRKTGQQLVFNLSRSHNVNTQQHITQHKAHRHPDAVETLERTGQQTGKGIQADD